MTGEDMIALVPRVNPDVVILDLRMPRGDGLSTLAQLRRDFPDLKVIILSMFEDPEHIDQALDQGAAGYVVKSINPLDLPSRSARWSRAPCTTPAAAPPTTNPRSGTKDRIGRAAPRSGGAHGSGRPHRARTLDPAAGRREACRTSTHRSRCSSPSNGQVPLSNIYRKLGGRQPHRATRYAYRNGLID